MRAERPIKLLADEKIEEILQIPDADDIEQRIIAIRKIGFENLTQYGELNSIRLVGELEYELYDMGAIMDEETHLVLSITNTLIDVRICIEIPSNIAHDPFNIEPARTMGKAIKYIQTPKDLVRKTNKINELIITGKLDDCVLETSDGCTLRVPKTNMAYICVHILHVFGKITKLWKCLGYDTVDDYFSKHIHFSQDDHLIYH